tara:strand:+ start:549 stop:926 length:378 start_codon:yes stop_codon:yes gene_type:complete
MEQFGQFILNHLGLWVALMVILLLVLINEWLGQKNKAKELSVAESVKLMNDEDAKVFDLRDTEAFKAGHISNAIQVKQNELEKEHLKKFKDQPIILVCNRGLQSQTVAKKLRDLEFQKSMLCPVA